MSDEQKIDNACSTLIERIREVFADVSYPGDDKIISSSEHVLVCGECGVIQKALVGRKWPELIDDVESSGYVSQGMSFFSAAAWQYYLPAYLIQSIKLRRFSSLCFQASTKTSLAELQQERANRLTPDQCRVVVAYLLIVQQLDCLCRYCTERNREAVDYWKNIYRRAASRNQDAG
jgi:Family of unknown function (DUF6714)